MVDTTSLHLIQWMDQTFRPLLHRWQSRVSFSDTDIRLLRLFWIFDLLYADGFDRDTYLAGKQTHLRPTHLLQTPMSKSLVADSQNQDCNVVDDLLLNLLTRATRLSFQYVFRQSCHFNQTIVLTRFIERLVYGIIYVPVSVPSKDSKSVLMNQMTKTTNCPNLLTTYSTLVASSQKGKNCFFISLNFNTLSTKCMPLNSKIGTRVLI